VTFDALWLNHVIQLTEQINKKNRLVVQVLQSVDLLLVKVIHLTRSNYLVVVQVNHFKPIVQSLHRALVLLTQHEVDKILVPHLACWLSFELPRNLLENSINSLSTECVAFVSRKVFLINEEVVVSV
jgi:hypothetical protein